MLLYNACNTFIKNNLWTFHEVNVKKQYVFVGGLLATTHYLKKWLIQHSPWLTINPSLEEMLQSWQGGWQMREQRCYWGQGLPKNSGKLYLTLSKVWDDFRNFLKLLKFAMKCTKWYTISDLILLAVVGDDLDVNDIHLLLEYKSGDKWGKFTSPRANRYLT